MKTVLRILIVAQIFLLTVLSCNKTDDDLKQLEALKVENARLKQKLEMSVPTEVAGELRNSSQPSKHEINAAQKEQDTDFEQKALDALRNFRTLKAIDIGEIKMSFRKIEKTEKWVFDRRQIEWSVVEPDKDAFYVVVDHEVTSKESNPTLPMLVVYFLDKEGNVVFEGDMKTRFYKWGDYGSYIGNYADTGNDFAKRNTIRFSTGIEIKDNDGVDRAILIGLLRRPCLVRTYNRFDRPPVAYSPQQCKDQCVPTGSTIHELLEKVAPVAVLARDKLGRFVNISNPKLGAPNEDAPSAPKNAVDSFLSGEREIPNMF